MASTVLIIDDEENFRVLAEQALQAEGFEVLQAGNLKKGREALDRTMPDVVILDRRLPDGDGIDFLKTLIREGASIPPILVVTAYGDIENAVEALRAGAWDYLAKPVQLTDLVIKLQKVLAERELKDRLTLVHGGDSGPPFVESGSPAMRKMIEQLRSVSASPLTPVLLLGPSGVGKQYASEMLHGMTCGKKDPHAPFVELNCAALPENLVESELFGHEKGAFTDARTARRGLIEMATGGTLFLDEVTELPLHQQAKLLKFIDTMRFRRLGGQREIKARLRIVAATNRNIRESVRDEHFREDLFHRLAVFEVSIPPLSERKEDIPSLADSFVLYYASRIKKPVIGISSEAETLLMDYSFPGNVRELRNIVERAVILCGGRELAPADLVFPKDNASRSPETGFFQVPLEPGGQPPPLAEVEATYLVHILEHFQGRRMAAAKALGISYPTFLKRLRELNLA